MKQKIAILMITTLIILTAYFMIIPVKASESLDNLKPLVLLKGTTNFSLEKALLLLTGINASLSFIIPS